MSNLITDTATPEAEQQKPAVDPKRLKVHRTPKRDVPYVPSDEAVVTAMLRFAGVSGNDVVYDLGCGDGRIVIAAARQYGARGVGVDIDPLRIQESREEAQKARVTDRVRFYCQSFFDTDLRDASVIMLYLLPSINVKLRPKLLVELKPGTRIVANYFGMGDWQADMQANVHNRVLHQWIVPAWVAGTWNCIINDPAGRRRIVVQFKRHYQMVSGTGRGDGREWHVNNGRLFGNQITFKLVDPKCRVPIIRFSGEVCGTQMRGTCQNGAEGEAMSWGAVWKGA